MPEEVLRAALGEAGPAIARLVPGLNREFPDLPTAPEVPPEQQRRFLFNAFTEFLEHGSSAGQRAAGPAIPALPGVLRAVRPAS